MFHFYFTMQSKLFDKYLNKMSRTPIIRKNDRIPFKPFNRGNNTTSTQKSKFSDIQSDESEQFVEQIQNKASQLRDYVKMARFSKLFGLIKVQNSVSQHEQKTKRYRSIPKQKSKFRNSQNRQDCEGDRIIADQSILRNSSNFSRLISQFQSIPQQECSKLQHIKNQIYQIRKTLNNTYDLLQEEHDNLKKNQKTFDKIVSSQKKKQVIKKDNPADKQNKTIKKRKKQTHKTSRRRRQFEQQRKKYLPRFQQNTIQSILTKDKKKIKETTEQQKTIIHQVFHPIIHSCFQPVIQTFIPTVLSPVHNQSFFNTSFVTVRETISTGYMTPRSNSSMLQLNHRPVTSRLVGNITPRAHYTVNFF